MVAPQAALRQLCHLPHLRCQLAAAARLLLSMGQVARAAGGRAAAMLRQAAAPTATPLAAA